MANHTYRIGDKVYARGRGGLAAEHVGIVIDVNDEGDAYVGFNDGWNGGHSGNLNDGATNRWFFSNDELRPVAAATRRNITNNNSPIRTVTRREIVPGVYGIVETCADGSVSVYHDGPPSASELREAAHLFNQIAEVLEEQSKEAA